MVTKSFPIGMSRADFDKLPPIISRKVFLFATGLNTQKFYLFVSAKLIRKLPVGKTGKLANYYKADAAKIAGYDKKENGNA